MQHHSSRAFQAAAPVSALASAVPTRPVLGLPVVDATTEQTVAALLEGSARSVFFLNAHCANLRARDRSYAAALARAEI